MVHKLGIGALFALGACLFGCSDDSAESGAAAGAGGTGAGVGGGMAASGNSAGGSAGTATGGGGAGGMVSTVDQFGCDNKTQVACRGQCLSTVGEQKDGCRLLALGARTEKLYLDGDDLFYAGFSGLNVIRLASLKQEEITSKPHYVEHIAAAGEFVYVTTEGDDSGTIGPGSLQRAPRAGGEAKHLADATGIGNLALVGDKVYFTLGLGSLFSVPADGSAMAADTMVDASSVIVDGADLIFAEAKFTNFPIKVASAGDVANATVIVPEVFDPTLIAVQGGNVYYLDDDGNIQRVPKAGGTPELVHAAVAGFAPEFWSAHDLLASSTVGNDVALKAMPVTGGEPALVGNFSRKVYAATSNATHYFAAIGSAIVEIAR